MCDNCLGGSRAKTDITVLAQKFLSCVRRTGETFGAHHVIDVLRGSKAEKVFKFNHQHLSTYGIGTECSKIQWVKLSRQFINKGLLIQDTEFGSLKLTANGWAVLKAEQTVMGLLEEEKAPKFHAVEYDAQYDRELFETLRKKRKALADKSGVPAYIIFSDKTLIEMATRCPQNRESFMDIHGVGNVKYENYGQTFIEVIRDHCRQHHSE